MTDEHKKVNFAKTITELEEINEWFQGDDIDLDEGLTKLKRGKDLIKKARARLEEVENEFVKIKDEFVEEENNSDGIVEEVKVTTTVISTEDEETEPDGIPF